MLTLKSADGTATWDGHVLTLAFSGFLSGPVKSKKIVAYARAEFSRLELVPARGLTTAYLLIRRPGVDLPAKLKPKNHLDAFVVPVGKDEAVTQFVAAVNGGVHHEAPSAPVTMPADPAATPGAAESESRCRDEPMAAGGTWRPDSSSPAPHRDQSTTVCSAGFLKQPSPMPDMRCVGDFEEGGVVTEGFAPSRVQTPEQRIAQLEAEQLSLRAQVAGLQARQREHVEARQAAAKALGELQRHLLESAAVESVLEKQLAVLTGLEEQADQVWSAVRELKTRLSEQLRAAEGVLGGDRAVLMHLEDELALLHDQLDTSSDPVVEPERHPGLRAHERPTPGQHRSAGTEHSLPAYQGSSDPAAEQSNHGADPRASKGAGARTAGPQVLTGVSQATPPGSGLGSPSADSRLPRVWEQEPFTLTSTDLSEFQRLYRDIGTSPARLVELPSGVMIDLFRRLLPIHFSVQPEGQGALLPIVLVYRHRKAPTQETVPARNFFYFLVDLLALLAPSGRLDGELYGRLGGLLPRILALPEEAVEHVMARARWRRAVPLLESELELGETRHARKEELAKLVADLAGGRAEQLAKLMVELAGGRTEFSGRLSYLLGLLEATPETVALAALAAPSAPPPAPLATPPPGVVPTVAAPVLDPSPQPAISGGSSTAEWDMARIAATRAASDRAREALQALMEADDLPTDHGGGIGAATVGQDSLPRSLRLLAERLATLDQLPTTALRALAEDYGLVPLEAVRRINDWADEHAAGLGEPLDAAVIEVDEIADVVWIDQALRELLT
jgi:hypothetical protein